MFTRFKLIAMVVVSLLTTSVYAKNINLESINNAKASVSEVTSEKEEVKGLLEYEKILKRMQDNKEAEEKLKLEKEKNEAKINNMKNEQRLTVRKKDPINFSYVGLITIQDKKIAYISLDRANSFNNNSKIVKVGLGDYLEDSNYQVTKITENGVTIIALNEETLDENEIPRSIYLPIVNMQTPDIDIKRFKDN